MAVPVGLEKTHEQGVGMTESGLTAKYMNFEGPGDRAKSYSEIIKAMKSMGWKLDREQAPSDAWMSKGDRACNLEFRVLKKGDAYNPARIQYQVKIRKK